MTSLQVKFLVESILSNRASHAWIINGSAGSNKRKFIDEVVSKIFVANINDDSIKDIVKKQIKAENYSNLLVIKKNQSKNNIPVDEIREIGKFLSLTASNDNPKFIIINKLDDLNNSSFNALLKILEEPPNNCYLFLLSQNLKKIPDTIKSRSSIIKLKSILSENFHNILCNNLNIDVITSKKLLSLAGNNLKFASKLYNENIITIYENFTNILNLNLNMSAVDDFTNNMIENGNLYLSIIVNNLIVNVIKYKTNIDYVKISECEGSVIGKICENKNIDKIFDLYNKLNKMLTQQEQSNLDLKQTILLIIYEIKK